MRGRTALMGVKMDGDVGEDRRAKQRERALGVKGACPSCVSASYRRRVHIPCGLSSNQKKKNSETRPSHAIQFSPHSKHALTGLHTHAPTPLQPMPHAAAPSRKILTFLLNSILNPQQ